MDVPMNEVKRLYDEMTICNFIEIDGYTEHGEYRQEVQVTGTHPEIGVMTIRQGQYGAEVFQNSYLAFEESEAAPLDTELEPGFTVRDWAAANPDRAEMAPFMAWAVFQEKHSAEAFAFVREKVMVMGIQPIKITCPLYDAPPPGWFESIQDQMNESKSWQEKAGPRLEENEELKLLLEEIESVS